MVTLLTVPDFLSPILDIVLLLHLMLKEAHLVIVIQVKGLKLLLMQHAVVHHQIVEQKTYLYEIKVRDLCRGPVI